MFTISFEEDDTKLYTLLKALAISATNNSFNIEEEGKAAELFFEIYSNAPAEVRAHFKQRYSRNVVRIMNIIIGEAEFFEKAAYCAGLIDKFSDVFKEYRGD